MAVFLCAAGAEAQNPAVLPASTPVEAECGLIASEMVTLNLSVWSKNKGYLRGLSDKNFEIFDGKTKQPIEFFKQQDEPLSVGILFDLSDSMENRAGQSEIPLAVDGLISFINASNPQNEYFIIAFAREAATLLEPTQNRKEIETALKILLSGKKGGNTSFFDALNGGFEKLSKGRFDKKMLLVVSDGVDNNSKNNFADIKRKTAQNSNVMLYQINLLTDSLDDGSLEALQSANFFERIVEKNGGRVFYPKNRRQTTEAFETLTDELKSQ